MTLAQILAIIALLSAFGAPDNTLLEVENILLQTQKATVAEQTPIYATSQSTPLGQQETLLALEVKVKTNSARIYGANCSQVFVDAKTSKPSTITFFNPETRTEERKESPATFVYKPQATSTVQNLIVYVEGTNARFEQKIDIHNTLLAYIPTSHLRDFSETFWTTTNGEKIDKVTKKCL